MSQYKNININPGASEICSDGKDNDCDGSIDCNDSGCVGSSHCVDQDKDNDGYDSTTYGGSDCDNDPNINPGASEICSDGKDNDCDGDIDEGCPLSSPPRSHPPEEKLVILEEIADYLDRNPLARIIVYISAFVSLLYMTYNLIRRVRPRYNSNF